jgi:UDP-N-acetylmuramyl-tripeptide synthetase
VVVVADSRKAMSRMAANFYKHPSKAMTLIGITGTNGKTTTSYLVEHILRAAGLSCGVIGTINYRFGGRVFDNPVTTPESLDLQRILAQMHTDGVTHVAMEVSSHALDLYRAEDCFFDIGVFTNFNQDHLDYHRTMEAYWQCKQRLFKDLLPASADVKQPRAIFNTEDPRGRELAEMFNFPFLTTGRRGEEDIRTLRARFDLNGVTASIRTPGGVVDIRSPLLGRHNLENILNAAAVGISLGLPSEAIKSGIETLDHVPGRLERVPDQGGRFVYVDYAHKPDALENVLLALRNLTPDRIVCIFGCGGDRDRIKRPRMGAISARLSDLSIITSDNPRSEPPLDIIEEIVAGVKTVGLYEYDKAALETMGFEQKGYVLEPDRRKAIRLGVNATTSGDTLLIAGKGHEPYQVIGKEKFTFDDRVEVAKALRE